MKLFSRRPQETIGPEALLERWRTQSQERGWLRDSDWICSAARSVASVMAQRQDPVAAIRSLASRRAIQGVGIAEALSDIQSLFEVFPHPDLRNLTVVFADAWVESTDLFSHQLTCWDSKSGLSNRQHFERRAHELRESPLTRDRLYVMALYRHLRTDHDEQSAFMLSADIGQACKNTIPEAVATHRGSRLALLMEKNMPPDQRLESLGLELERVLESHGVPGQSLRLDVEPVPVATRDLQRLLGTLWQQKQGPASSATSEFTSPCNLQSSRGRS